jgi:transposase
VCQDIGDTYLKGFPVDMARYLVEAHVLEGRRVSELAAAHGVHRSWIYKLIARYQAGGYEALQPRSRRPRSCASTRRPQRSWRRSSN